MVLWDTSPPSSRSAGFLNQVAISCLNDSSLDLLACREASRMSLDLVTVPQLQGGVFLVVDMCYHAGGHVVEIPGFPMESQVAT